MKPKYCTALLTATIAFCTIPLAKATDLYWDGSGTMPTTPNGGSGPWDNSSTSYWSNASSGGTYVAWNNATPDNAHFSNTGGTVTLGSAITAGTVQFGTTGYVIDTNGFNATFGGVVSGSSFTKAGAGTLTLSSASSNTPVVVSAGTLVGTTSSSFSYSSALTVNNASTGSSNTSLLTQNTGGSGTTYWTHPITVANLGTGTVTIGSLAGSSGNNYYLNSTRLIV